MRGSRNFRQGGGGGGGPGQSDKKALTTFYTSQMVNFKKTIIFQCSRGGPTFPGGSNFFQRGGGGGSNRLFPIETYIACDFPGGPDPLSPLWIRTWM